MYNIPRYFRSTQSHGTEDTKTVTRYLPVYPNQYFVTGICNGYFEVSVVIDIEKYWFGPLLFQTSEWSYQYWSFPIPLTPVDGSTRVYGSSG